jgi:hypothetical protein
MYYHFPKNLNEIFIYINRNKYNFKIECIKVFHYYNFGIGNFYAPKGTGKSILFRSIFLNFSNLNDKDRYTPFIFFKIELIKNLIDKEDILNLKKIITHESYSLFEIKKEADEFIKSIDFKENNIMKFIENIINKAINEINKNYIVFILDGYSFHMMKKIE